MTISTPRTDRQSPRPPDALLAHLRPARRRRAFTLVEVMIAAALGSLVLAGVLSAFIFIARTGFRASSYSELEAEVRRGLETFARDARNASDVRWQDAQTLTLTVAGAAVTYAYDPNTGSATYQCFYRVSGSDATARPRTVLIRNVASDFAFARYKLEQPNVSDNTAANDRETKQLQVSLRPLRTNSATVGASQTTLSARYLLRNKRVAR